MEERRRLEITWLLIAGLFIPLLCAFIAFAPIWHCPGCDRNPHYRNLEGEELPMFWDPGIPERCSQCNHSGRMTLVRRWQLREHARSNGLTFPLFR